MTTDPTITTKETSMTASPKTGDLRVTWNIHAHGQGHGEWFPPEQYSMLMSHVRAMNEKYGEETHWIETHA